MTTGGDRTGPLEAAFARGLLVAVVLAAFVFLAGPPGLPSLPLDDLFLDNLPVRAAEANSAGGVETPPAAEPFPGFPMDLNTSTAEDLRSLPGVGPVTARRIVEQREALGGYSSIDELLDVRWIGPARLAELRPLVRASAPASVD